MELIAAATRSPFNLEIREARLSKGFKLPAIKAYEGKSDSQDHLDHFNNLMELHFVITLIVGAQKWFRVIPTGMISSW